MKKKFLGIGILTVVALALAGCGRIPIRRITPASDPNPPTITVNGTGKVFLVPDVATINIGVESRDASVTTALEANNEKAKAISAKLQEMGVEAKDIQTSGFNIYPIQNYTPEGTPAETTYNVSNTVNVTVRDLTKLGEILESVVQVGANSINGINFDVVDRSKAISEARKMAVSDAKVQAEEVAAAAGVSLAGLQNITVYIDNGAVPVYDGRMMASAESAVPVSAGQLGITVSVTASYLISR